MGITSNPYVAVNQSGNIFRSLNVLSGDNIMAVESIEDVKNARLDVNSRAPYFDNNEDKAYVKTTGGSQFDYKIDIFELKHIGTYVPGQGNNTPQNYVTKEDFDSMKEELLKDVKLLIQGTGQSTTKQQHSGNSRSDNTKS